MADAVESRGRSASVAGLPPRFPFSAVVGQESLKLALVLTAVTPSIGGVLIRGEKGTAKSTAVRGLGPLLGDTAGVPGAGPRGGVVELPLGATEDRVVGSIDLSSILSGGAARYTPGLLAAADGGVLYVDEVNLLHDHLVDVLLDAAAMGRVHVERDGISHTDRASFVLVGTMNPEEGELRPQLLDRFGFAVDVTAPRDVAERTEVVRRRLAYETDPDAFAARFAAVDAELAERIAAARARVGGVTLPERELTRISALCASFGVDGLRGDIVIARAALAHAAWRGADEVTADDVRAAAELALPHRRRRDPFDEPGAAEDDLQRALDDAAEHADGPEDDPDGSDPSGGGADAGAAPDAPPEGDTGRPAPSGDAPTGRTSAPGRASAQVKPLRLRGVGDGTPGRRSPARTSRGRVVRPTTSGGHGVHLVATLLTAAGRGAGRVDVADVRRAEREGREGNLVVFLLDLSGSMAARRRLDAVIVAVVAVLRDAYQRRDRVAVVAIRGAAAEVVVPPTRSVDLAVRRLTGLPTGGRTPLAEGLVAVADLLRRQRIADPQRRVLLIAVTDGRATSGTRPRARAQRAATALRREAVDTGRLGAVVVDCEDGHVRLGLAAELGRALGGETVRLRELTGRALAGLAGADSVDVTRKAA